jgi:hypothetical protein
MKKGIYVTNDDEKTKIMKGSFLCIYEKLLKLHPESLKAIKVKIIQGGYALEVS